MNRKLNFLLIATVVVAFFQSCSNEDVYDPTRESDLKKAQYEAAFVKKFGEIAPNQNWGFGVAPTSRAANPNNNEWSKQLDVPNDWDYIASKREEIKKLFQNPDPAYIVDNVNWSDFFVQYVWHNNSYNMNELTVHKTKNDVNGEHVMNFNKTAGGIMLMQNSGTASFSYKGEGGTRFSKYIIMYFEGNYYVGFDYENYMNQVVEPDGDYSDWIVKISPANYTSARRIMAEDLGEIGDFDFNDVVFDAAIINGGDAVITLRAAGGTLPLYIGGESEANEVHNRFGVDVRTMVNTAPGKHQEMAPVVFRLSGYAGRTINDIPITVNGITLSAETGKAPGKLSVPTTVDWANESQAIDNKYTKFKDYVSNPEIKWWE